MTLRKSLVSKGCSLTKGNGEKASELDSGIVHISIKTSATAPSSLAAWVIPTTRVKGWPLRTNR